MAFTRSQLEPAFPTLVLANYSYSLTILETSQQNSYCDNRSTYIAMKALMRTKSNLSEV